MNEWRQLIGLLVIVFCRMLLWAEQVEKLLADKDELNARILVLEKELRVARSEVDDLSVVVLDLSSPARGGSYLEAFRFNLNT